MADTFPKPVVFIHGLWLHSSSWQPWIDLFNESGYARLALRAGRATPTPSRPRARTPTPSRTSASTRSPTTTPSCIAELPAKPIVIGHSFGGLIVEKLLGEGHAAAGVAIDAAPIKGVLPLPISALRVAFAALSNPGNIDAAVSLTPEQFHYGFGNALTPEESAELYERWTIPSPGPARCSRPPAPTSTRTRRPRSTSTTRTAARCCSPWAARTTPCPRRSPSRRTSSTASPRPSPSIVEFEDRGHSLTIDHGWREVADSVLAWLKGQGL